MAFMVGKTLLATSILLLLGLSGCLGDEPATTEPLDAGDKGTSKEDGSATGSSGTTTTSPDDPSADVQTATAQPFSWDGAIGYQVAACVMGNCYGTGAGDWDNAYDVDGMVSGDLTVTWDLPTELGFGLASQCDGRCDFVAYTGGTSPATLSFIDLDPETTYTLVAWHPYRSQLGVAGVQAGTQTDFQVTGTLMVV